MMRNLSSNLTNKHHPFLLVFQQRTGSAGRKCEVRLDSTIWHEKALIDCTTSGRRSRC